MYVVMFVDLVDFSLSQWLREKAVVAGSVLQPHHVSELFEKLSIKAYKRTPSCDRNESVYASPDGLGWNNGNKTLKRRLNYNNWIFVEILSTYWFMSAVGLV